MEQPDQPTAPDPERPARPETARSLARRELTRRIMATAREQLELVGAPALSLRAIARELGMASSAVYRYVASRDDLLTMLLIECYSELADAAEAAERQVPRDDLAGRWRAICHAIRDWARAHPHDYALLYGSPVPGYEAPEATVDPASRVTALMAALLPEAAASGTDPAPMVPVPRQLEEALEPVRQFLPVAIPDGLWLRALMAWSAIFGTISFELFGHYEGGVTDLDAYFAHVVEQYAADLGLEPAPVNE